MARARVALQGRALDGRHLANSRTRSLPRRFAVLNRPRAETYRIAAAVQTRGDSRRAPGPNAARQCAYRRRNALIAPTRVPARNAMLWRSGSPRGLTTGAQTPITERKRKHVP